MEGYPLENLFEEVAFIAYYFHWSYEEILNLEHRERRQWCQEISRINQKIKKGSSPDQGLY
ncbi:DUF6760 family protein [Thermosulfuriphilus sp.]